MLPNELGLLLVLVLLTNLVLLGSERLSNHIRTISLQGMLISLITVFAHHQNINSDTWIIAATNFLVMSVLAPWMLRRAGKQLKVQENIRPYMGYVSSLCIDIRPYMGYVSSLCIGIGLSAFSFWLLAEEPALRISPLFRLLPFAVVNVLCGLFLITFRRTAITQVIGYLVLANGVTLFGIGLASEQPLLVEMGILLDAFFAVLVMGFAIYHINLEFETMDVSRLNALEDRV